MPRHITKRKLENKLLNVIRLTVDKFGGPMPFPDLMAVLKKFNLTIKLSTKRKKK